MIGIAGQYLMSFDLDDNRDFILRDYLNEFTIIEDSGNVLPTFELEFITLDEDILPKLNETKQLKLSFGVDQENLFDVPLQIFKMIYVENGREGYIVSISGIYDKSEYIIDPSVFISEKKSGIEVASDTILKNFKLESNVDKSGDIQNWIQFNTSDQRFVMDTILHSNIKDSFPLMAITIDGIFRLKDVKEDLNRSGDKYDYRLTMNPKKPNDIRYDNNPRLTSNTGFINNIAGYGREVLEQNQDSGVNTTFIEESEPIMALTKNLARKDNVRFAGTKVINENVHANYWKSYQNNITNIISLGNISVIITIDDYFYPIHPLDLIMLNAPSKKSTNSSEYVSGLYYVSKVSRTWSNNKFTTSLLICREAVNQVKK